MQLEIFTLCGAATDQAAKLNIMECRPGDFVS
jgi:hypothetical protein